MPSALSPVRSLLLLLLLAPQARATEYQVGPSRPYRTLQSLPALLHPGDVVAIDGGAAYQGGISLDGTGGPGGGVITVKGLRVKGLRPVISGVSGPGGTVLRVLGSHYLLEDLDITAGGDSRARRCFYNVGDDVTLRDCIVHDAPTTGIAGADASGSLTLDHVEVCRCGRGLFDHQIYVGSSLALYPRALFQMRFCYVHDGAGGNNVKSRVTRNEIEYNWIEGASFHELDLIGPDPKDQKIPKAGLHCDADVVGNVIIVRPASLGTVVRLGTDGNASSRGKYRFAYNTVIIQSGGAARFGLFWLKGRIDSLVLWNNVFWGKTDTLRLIRNEAGGSALLAGAGNWLPAAATDVPSSWRTLWGTDPGFANADADDYRPGPGSPLIGAGATPPKRDIVALEIPPARNIASQRPRPLARERDIGAYPGGR